MTAIDDKKLDELMGLVQQIREIKAMHKFITHELLDAPRYTDGRIMWPVKLDIPGQAMPGHTGIEIRLTDRFNTVYEQWLNEIKAEIEAELEQLAEAVTKVLL